MRRIGARASIVRSAIINKHLAAERLLTESRRRDAVLYAVTRVASYNLQLLKNAQSVRRGTWDERRKPGLVGVAMAL